MSYEAVIFDLDGVVTDTARYHYLAWKRLADELGIYFDELINERLRGVSRMASFEIILERTTRPYSPQEKDRHVATKNGYYQALLADLTPGNILPGTMDLLAALKARRVRTALASASRNAPFVLERLGLERAFQAVVDAASIRNPKPHPEMFLRAAEGLGVPPPRCIGVEDAAAGITAIHRAGMYAVGVGREETVAEADLLLKDLTEYPRILALIEG